jgi:hypothetical protein
MAKPTEPTTRVDVGTESGLFVLVEPARAGAVREGFQRDPDAVVKLAAAAGAALIEAGADGPARFDVHVLPAAPGPRGAFGWAAKAKAIEIREGHLRIAAPEDEDGAVVHLGAGTWAVAVREGDGVPPPAWGIQAVAAHGSTGVALDAQGILHVLDLPSLAETQKVSSGVVAASDVVALGPGKLLVSGIEARTVELASGKGKRVGKDTGWYEPVGGALWATWTNRTAGVRLQDHGGADKGSLKGLRAVARRVRAVSPERLAVLDPTGALHLYDVASRERVAEARVEGGSHLAVAAGALLVLAGGEVHELDAATLAPRRTLAAGKGALAVLAAGARAAVLADEGRTIRWLGEGGEVSLPGPAVATACTAEGILVGLEGGAAWIAAGAGAAKVVDLLGVPPPRPPSEGDYVVAAWPR